ncbi:MAG: chromosome segregation protein SMC [Deltaproteobacteria bacterium]|nr:chromosome segregation protein SMC [Deltaproteobacteria bacterium]
MKIKQVSIHGFKSFPERLEINFPTGISGVVGPNGCGKSNVVDAIRWCMGEQSPKLLRGRKMEDVIFSGAGNCKPLGMAEVSLLFENGTGDFPPAFAHNPELSVTRRLYRSGESEYMLNNVPCRLKDIQEVFMDTGLGNKAYSIIGQGQIGNIIEQRPEETRIMLEEAAGITKYRKKVAVSQKKIELTEANLQRVGDILSEIEKQIRSLKRQAAKAARYKALSSKIQDLELAFFGNTYEKLTADVGHKMHSTEALMGEKNGLAATLSRHDAKIVDMNLELEEKEEDLSACRKAHFDCRDRVQKKEASIQSLEGELKTLLQLASRLATEQGDVRTNIVTLEKKKDHLKGEILRLQGETTDLEAEAQLEEERLKTRKRLFNEIRENFEKARDNMSAGETHAVGLNHETGYLNKALEQVSDSRSRLENELAETAARSESILKTSERKTSVRKAITEKLQEIENSIEETGTKTNELESIKKRVEAEAKKAESDLNSCRSRMASLEGLMENFEGYKAGVRTIMRAGDFAPGNQGRVLGILADVIEVAPQYEKALEAVLAEKLQYVITKTKDDAAAAVGYLKEKGRGIGSFAPLEDLIYSTKESRSDSKFLPLRNFVTTSKEFEPLINDILNNTVLVDDVSTALAALGKNGHTHCFVTPEGDVVDQRGVITGGRLSHASRGLLARKREIVELKKEVAAHKRKFEDLSFQLEDILAGIEENQGAVQRLTDEKWSCRDDISDVDKILFRLGQELDQSEKLSRKIQEDLKQKEIEQENQQEQLKKLQSALHESREKQAREAAYFHEKELELKEAEAEFEHTREKASKLREDCRLRKESQRGVAREMDMVDNYRDDSQDRLEAILKDTEHGQQRRQACEAEGKVLKESLKSLYEELRQAEELMNHSELDYRSRKEAIKEEEHRVSQLKDQIDRLTEEINSSKMAQSEIRFKIDNLLERVQENFGVNMKEIYKQFLQDDFDEQAAKGEIENQRAVRNNMGEVNLTAIREYEALKERHDFILEQRQDLLDSIESLNTAIKKINRTSLEKFNTTFHEVDQKLKEIFPILFSGGTASLRLTDEQNPLEGGVLVEVQPPGKRLSHMGLLSGGEKALVAMALIFAIYMIKPSPFCLLDEVDAPLDEANIDRFNDLLNKIKKDSQIIMVTHSRKTMAITDCLFGITMENKGVSKLVSVDIQNLQNQ